MVRPRKYKTEKEQLEAARKRQREWYHRNKHEESAKALSRYHHIHHNGDFKPKVQSPKPHMSLPVHEEQYNECQEVLANSDMLPTFGRLNTRVLNAAEETLRTWHDTGSNINDVISKAQHVFDAWTSGSLRAWGAALYLTTELNTDATRTEDELQPYLTLGKDLQDRFEAISRQSF
ncbi:hypothetical protein BD410DRAFT_845962 [Rickenella mellea]|uniref:Uncharacterized protein n=1 Tax=Rickenella mellea TaxID=50990 RepID=A0A4Y7PI35_9AGAM|nr:hypothetical protein BD410DRAFT_845962 [Rickenella mellea]